MTASKALYRDPLVAALLGAHDDAGRAHNCSTPSVDFSESEAAYTLLADMPGLGQDDVKLELHNRTLTVTGGPAASRPASPSKQPQADATAAEAAAAAAARFASARRRTYRRTLQLPNDVDEAGISASMDKGVLQVTLPKRKSALPRQIAVSGPAGSGMSAAQAV